MTNEKQDPGDLFTRIPADLAVLVREIAADETRSASQQIRHYIRAGLRRDGYDFDLVESVIITEEKPT